jgi:O-acetyl-ADP-ribose deacetylase (regulator of RNase III)
VKLFVTLGDIAAMDVDVVVNAANAGLHGGGGVDGAIHRAAGPDLPAACRRIGGCDVGSACVTPGFALPARWIVHAVGPVWRGGQAGEAELLASCYARALDLAGELEARSIAFPAISCGAYGFPVSAACRIGFDVLRAWQGSAPREAWLVAFDDRVRGAWEDLAGRDAVRPPPLARP